MKNETGSLPVGVEVDGVLHRDFEVRPRLVRDSIAALEDPKAQGNEIYRGVALTAQQIVRLGTLPKDKISTALLLDMYDVDLSAIMEAAGRMESRLLTFRGAEAGKGSTQAASDAAEDRGPVAAGA